MARAGLMLVVLLVALTSRTFAAAADTEFDAANKLYAQGKYPAAATAYEKILVSGAAGSAVYFNLGNAHFKAGQPGRAIAAYRQAERLAPRDPDVRANLQFARERVGNVASVRPGLAARALGRLTFNEWTALAGAAATAWFTLLALGQWRSAWRAPLGGYVLLAGLATLALTASAAADWQLNASVKSAVVVAAETSVRTGPLDDAQAGFVAKAGTELTVLDEREDWLQVQNGSRQTGWVQRSAVQAW